jgi:hypothetical protein
MIASRDLIPHPCAVAVANRYCHGVGRVALSGDDLGRYNLKPRSS